MIDLPAAIQSYFVFANSKNWLGMADLFTCDAELRAVGARPRYGRDDILAFYPKTTSAWTTNIDTPLRCTTSGSVAVVELLFNGVDTSGRPFEFDAVDVFDLSEARIRKVSIWYDIAAVQAHMKSLP